MIPLRRIAPLAFVLAGLAALPARAEVQIQTVTSPGGITAWLAESHDIPFTALEIRFRGGTSLDDPAHRGAVNLMTALIEEGAGDLDAQGFAAARDGLAASYSFSADADTVGVSAQFLTENRDKAVDLLHLALTKPRFDADAVERVRGQVLANLASNVQDPDHIAGDALSALAFGEHPYATSGDGTEESVTALTRADVLAAFKAAIARDRIYVAAAGDITPADLGRMLDRLFDGLPAKGAPLPGRAPLNLTGGVTVIDYPGPQSSVLFASAGIRRDDPDFFAATVLNEVLGGGGFSSRLMEEVREKRGLTYGISTALVGYDQAELLMGQARTGNEKTAQALQVIRDEYARIAKDGITDDELAKTKTYLTGSYPLRFDGNGANAAILVGMQMLGLPPDYPKTRNARIDAVTSADVARVAARLIKPDALRFVVVGQPAGVKSSD